MHVGVLDVFMIVVGVGCGGGDDVGDGDVDAHCFFSSGVSASSNFWTALLRVG